MITFEEARRIALKEIGPDFGLIDEWTVEKPYGWYFVGQGKAYCRSRNIEDAVPGSGGFIVEREDGFVFGFGSGHSPDFNLAAYEAGFRYHAYDLTILGVEDLESTVRLLLALAMTYVIPEEDHGTVWRIPQRYTEAQIRSALSHLPHTFPDLRLYLPGFQAIVEAGCCRYQLHGRRAGRAPTLVQPGRFDCSL